MVVKGLAPLFIFAQLDGYVNSAISTQIRLYSFLSSRLDSLSIGFKIRILFMFPIKRSSNDFSALK